MSLSLRRIGVLCACVVLVGAFAWMVEDATTGGDWPGWDEGWVIVAFPLGVPAAVSGGLALIRDRASLGPVMLVTGAVWLWGALLFLVWVTAVH